MLDRLLVLGAAGDLATRHLLPALATLLKANGLPAGLRVTGIGREQLDDSGYRALADQALARHAPGVASSERASLVARMDYQQADLMAEPDLRAALGAGSVVAYLALPPSIQAPAVLALGRGGLGAGSRVIVEKPFGHDLRSARELSRLLHGLVSERNVYRVDHFLHHQIVHDLLALRLANPLFASAWDARVVERVEIVWEESSAVTGRTDFYDGTGALRDMIQSHLLQLVAIVAMEPPSTLDDVPFRDAKAGALRAIPSLTRQQVAGRTVRARYSAGALGEHEVAAYAAERGVDPSRGTETYAAVVLEVDTPRWRGVPFVVRAGKALGVGRRSITVWFRSCPRPVLPSVPTCLCLEMSPDRVTVSVATAERGGLPQLETSELAVRRPPATMPASSRLLRDVWAGDPTYAVRDDEVEESWRITESILAGWQAGATPLHEYPAGSSGPPGLAGLHGAMPEPWA